MKQVTQTVLTAPGGDCFPACLASILELPLDRVPNFQGDDWQLRYHEWLRPFGLALLTTAVPAEEHREHLAEVLLPGYTILAVDSPRFAPLLHAVVALDGKHAVVALDGKVVWDPHPAAAPADYPALVWREVSYLVALDAGKLIRSGSLNSSHINETRSTERR